MKENKIIKKVSFILIHIVLVLVLSFLEKDILKAQQMFDIKKLNIDIIFTGLILLIFGLLVEYDRLLEAFKDGFDINKLKFIIAIIMLIISLLPYGFIINILNYKIVRGLFSIWSGIMISRSLMIKNPIDIKEI